MGKNFCSKKYTKIIFDEKGAEKSHTFNEHRNLIFGNLKTK